MSDRPRPLDEPKPPTKEELATIEFKANEFLRAYYAADVVPSRARASEETSLAMLVRQLIAEVRRLRQLVVEAEPHMPDNEATRTMDLPARLKAEADR